MDVFSPSPANLAVAFQDVPLQLELSVFLAQPHEFLALSAAQDVLAACGLATVGGGLRHPIRDALGSAAELTRQLRRRAARLDQLAHLSAEFRRIRRPRCRHIGLLLP
jgi:hypothetical protein